MLTRLVCLTVLSALLTAAALPLDAGVLRVMTFNIHAGHGDLARIASVIRDTAADVVALQEVDVHWAERSGFVDQAAALAETTGMDVRFAPIYRLQAPTPGNPVREFGVALLTRMPITSWRNHAITRLSTQRGETSAPGPAPGFLEVTIRTPGGEVDVFATHLDFRPDPAVRRAQVADMLAIVGAARHPVILMGDLNAPPEAPELRPLFGPLRDVWDAREGRGATYPADAPTKRIDYVLVSPRIRVLRTRVVRTGASDHLPLVADLAMPD